MATAFTTANEDVLAAISEWAGFASLQPRPVIRMAQRHNEIAENLKSFGLRPSIWIVRLSSTSDAHYTPNTQMIRLRYRVYIASPTRKESAVSDLVYHCNAALLQFSNWLAADGTALVNPLPWVYHSISGPEQIDPAQLADQEIDLEDIVAVLETTVNITASHADLMAVPNMTLTAAQDTIEATQVGTVYNDWDAGYGHTPDTMQVKYSNVGGKPLRRVCWMRFPLGTIADAVEIDGITIEYTITVHDGIMAFGSLHLTDLDIPSADAATVWAELLDGIDGDSITLSSPIGAKSTTLLDPGAFSDLLEHIQAGNESWIAAITYSPDLTARDCTLSPTLSLSRIIVDYKHYV